MDAYTAFARVYDNFMDNIPYDEWCEYLKSLLKEQGVSKGLVLELGCGTGNITELLAKAGYDMIGVDYSEEMLDKAMEKKEKSGYDILYLCQDMREFELYGTVSAVVSICDSMNYVTETENLVQVFKLVNNYLDPSGIFIFDLNTRHKYEEIGDSCIAEDRDDESFIWENYFDEEENINEYDLSVFIKGKDGRFDKFKETHFQRAYSLDEIKNALKEAGMEFVDAFDAFTKNPVREDSERIYVIAKECGKQNNKTRKGQV
jgi:SAM-dependent methyltransferase